ncbi:MAG: ABC transporter substrate-binding protein [Methanomicrobiales archaeon HGW-Methanomicrobiales-3]|jgi:iron(III) transport system substrate-binding protein|nr:MAG: ABC transporter substrate-binding protein [Methanomicrobiales archaeon HGW-Methanomicrobiales-3]
MNRNTRVTIFAGLLILVLLVTGLLVTFPAVPADIPKKTVVVYTSVDQIYSEPVFHDFENETGIRVLAVYDVEATKTTGLVNRLIAEKNRPRADVFWSGEFGQTILLKNESVLTAYSSPSAADIPPQFLDEDDYWTGFGGRARVFIVNTDRLTPDQYPESIYDLLSARYAGNTVGIAYPMFGTTATHAAALYSYLGTDEARGFFTNISNREVRVVDGNSVVRDLVVDGQLAFGLTDTDDACGAVEKGAHVAIIVPDQGEGRMGTLVIPNTVALIAGAPHPDEAKAFIDYVLDKKTEDAMVNSGWIQIPSRDVPTKTACMNITGIKAMNISYQEVYTGIPATQKDLIEIFIR